MEQNNKSPRQYSGTRGLSLAVVIGVAIGTVIGKLMNNMNTGLMLGLVLGVSGWVLLFNRRQKSGTDDSAEAETTAQQQESDTDAK